MVASSAHIDGFWVIGEDVVGRPDPAAVPGVCGSGFHSAPLQWGARPAPPLGLCSARTQLDAEQ